MNPQEKAYLMDLKNIIFANNMLQILILDGPCVEIIDAVQKELVTAHGFHSIAS